MSMRKRFLSVVVSLTSFATPALAASEQEQIHSEAGSGADDCIEATVQALPVPGAISIFGNNSTATGPDDCAGGANGPIWWEAFSITQCADLEISLCGTTPHPVFDLTFVTDDCSAGEECDHQYATSVNTTVCPDENIWMLFPGLPAGTYHYPIVSWNPSDYQMNITTSECIGACCNPAAGTCTEDVTETNCAGEGGQLFPNQTCVTTGYHGACCNLTAGTCIDDVTEPNCSGGATNGFRVRRVSRPAAPVPAATLRRRPARRT